ncbi:MAG: CHAP domain-containing protein [Patescibacteria group bacterium]|jgi:surface antigen/peptidoglycan hydrolase CwlO-like protein|nr:CHAP domain-containing protein [Patescibacteria group bacterium]
MLRSINKNTKKIFIIAAAVMFAASSVVAYTNTNANAQTTAELQQRTRELESKIKENNQQANALASEADALKRKIGELDIDISNMNTQIELTNVRLAELDVKLKEAQAELDRQKELLKASIITLYKKGGASTVELLVGSESFTEYFNEQTYLERLKAGIQESTEKVIALKQQIQTQQEEQKALLAQQQAQKSQLASARAERAQILADTQGKEANYREMNKKLIEEQRSIMAEIARRSTFVSGGGSGGYPYAGAVCMGTGQVNGVCPDLVWNSGGSVIDPWTYYIRNCTSYVAWRIAMIGFPNEVRYLGHGGQWGERAAAKGIATGYTPKVGAAASFKIGYFGHVAYVEEVLNGGSSIRISEYNLRFDGTYTQRIISTASVSKFVYFGE